MRKRVFLAVGFAVLVGALAACTPGPPSCPSAPVAADWGPVAAMNGQSSVDIELSRPYIIERVGAMLEGSQTGDSGAFVRSIDVKELPGPVSVLEVRLEPWQRGQDGTPVSLQRSYRLTLKITPHLVTPATVPDAARRKQLLCPASDPQCTANQGALLSFDLQELYNLSFSRVACDTPDMFDVRIVPAIYQNMAAQQPLVLPTESISGVLAGAAGATPNLVDVNISADGFLKVGLRYNLGATHTFDRVTELRSRFSNTDWGADIDKSILTAAVRARMLKKLVERAPGSSITSFSATFSPGEIRANAVGALTVPSLCGGTTTVTIDAHNPMQVCKDANNQSAIVSWTDATYSTNNFCVSLATFWDNIGVGTISGPPPVWPTLAPVQFSAGANDTFYGTALDLDNAFMIVGRSTLMDAKLAAAGQPRPASPGNCPGVP